MSKHKPTIIENESPQAYKITVTDPSTGKVIQEYATETVILFGIDKNPRDPQTPIQMVQLGTGPELIDLLQVVNGAVGAHIASLIHKVKSMTDKKKGASN